MDLDKNIRLDNHEWKYKMIIHLFTLVAILHD